MLKHCSIQLQVLNLQGSVLFLCFFTSQLASTEFLTLHCNEIPSRLCASSYKFVSLLLKHPELKQTCANISKFSQRKILSKNLLCFNDIRIKNQLQASFNIFALPVNYGEEKLREAKPDESIHIFSYTTQNYQFSQNIAFMFSSETLEICYCHFDKRTCTQSQKKMSSEEIENKTNFKICIEQKYTFIKRSLYVNFFL